jgi:hypothetical protein
MKLKIKTDSQGDLLLRKIAIQLNITPEQFAEFAIYNTLASYLANEHGIEAANDFLQHVVAHPGDLPARERRNDPPPDLVA